MTRALAAATVASLVLLSAAPGRADGTHRPSIRDAKNYYQLHLPADWKRVTPAAGPELILVAASGPGSQRTLALTRIDYPNPKRTKTAFHDQVETGLESSVPGYKRLRRKHRKLQRVPVMDLTFRRETTTESGKSGREVVWMRFLYFRTFTLSLAVAAPYDRYRRLDKKTRQLVESFQPYFEDD